jgi:4-amino-4-deoxy-L-arabinose transferase-like glycosyltransferase
MSQPLQSATLPSRQSQAPAGEPPAHRARAWAAVRRPQLHHLALAGVLVISGVLNLHRLSQNGYGNIFYSAGDKSMLRSLHNFFFVSFDPGGLVTVDKPPLGLWVQVASAKLFGFSPLSLLLPEAILGILAALLLYRAVARRLGGWAGVAAALTLVVFPSFVAVSRTTNIDTLLILLMILACDAGVRAAETGRWRTIIWSGVLVGLAFNTKTLAAYFVVPGIALAVLVCAPGSLGRRLTQVLAAGLAMLVVSFAWIAVVEATPASKRPYVGSSTNNTELGVTFSYNGFGRVGGQTGGPGQIPVGTGGVARKVSPAHAKAKEATKTHIAPEGPKRTEILPNGRARNPIAFGGPTGPLRLFGKGLDDQGAWMLPFALAGLVALALLLLGGERDRRDPRMALLFAFGGWFAAEAAVLSLSKGIVHPYYISALGPGVAAMVGAGAFAFAEFAKGRDWRLLLLPCGVAATVAVQLSLLHKVHYMSWFTAPLIALSAAGLLATALAVVIMRRAAPVAIGLSLGALLIAPGVYSATNWLAPVQSTFPAAGPRQAAGPGGYGVDAKHVAVDRALLRYVDAHRPGTRWAVLGDASNTVSPMILLGGRAGALGGFSGTDPVLSGAGLARLVADGRARYVVLGGEFSTRGGNGATVAVQSACRLVTTRAWLPRPLAPNGLILFDCSGRQAAMAAS